jgi:hypothetical protein
MYATRPGLILGFHGCDRSVVDNICSGKDVLNRSENSYDWLGHGIYFWENSPSRALEFAQDLKAKSKTAKRPIEKPAVLGAVIDLGFCLDLLEYNNLQLLKESYELVVASSETGKLPQNKAAGEIPELMLRHLDCAVIESLHEIRERNKLMPFDAVRGVFWEGKKLYPNAGFREKNHIQICIRNPNCIKGFFLPRKLDENFQKV